MKEKKEMTLKQAKTRRFICRLAFFLVAFATPIAITATKFHLFTEYTHAKLSIVGVLLVLVVAWRFKRKLGEWINSWENSNIAKHILIGIGRVYPFILVVIILGIIHWSGNKILGDALFCLEWTCVCELAAYLVLYPIEMKLDYIVQRNIRKNERKEDYKEAISEMKEEE